MAMFEASDPLVSFILFGRKISPQLRAIVSNTGWLFFDRVLRMIGGFILGVWIARHLGVHQYGLFNFVAAFVYLFNPLATLGLDNIVVRHLAQNTTPKNVILGTTFWLKLVGGVLSLLLAIGSIVLLRSNESLTLSLVAIGGTSGIFYAFDTIDLWFQSQVQSKYTVLARNIAFFGIALVKVALLILKAPLIAFAWAGLAEIGLSAIAMVGMYQLKGDKIGEWRWQGSLAKSLLKEGFPLLLSGFTIMIYMKIDQIMLGQMVGDRAVGIYAAATRLSEAWYFIPTVIISSVSPALYQARDRSKTDYYRYIGRLLRLMNAIAVAVALPITVLAPQIIQFCYGAAYLEASSVLVIHIWAAVFVFMGVTTLPYFIAEGLTNLTFQRTFMGAIINIILNFFLIPPYQGVGAAVATVISQAIASYFSHAFHPKTRKLFWLQTRSLLFLR